jgi:tetratricopeptide (TPR) repeat protein
MRQYARDRLEESGDAEALCGRHLEYCRRLVEELDDGQGEWLERLETEQDNFRAALEWSRGAEERVESGLRLALALWRFWATGYPSREARGYLLGLLERGPSVAPKTRGAGLLAAAEDCVRQCDFKTAREMLEEGLGLLRKSGDLPRAARALNLLGTAALRQGAAASARAWLEESLALHQKLPNPQTPRWLLFQLGEAARREGDLSSARLYLEESLVAFRAHGDDLGVAWALQSLGCLAAARGDGALSRSMFDEILEIGEGLEEKGGISCREMPSRGRNSFQLLGSQGMVAKVLNGLGYLAWRHGEFDAARSRYTHSLAISRETGNVECIGRSLRGLGLALVRLGEHAAARSAACESLRIWQQREDKGECVWCLECLAQVALAQGAPERMARLFGAAEALREALHYPLQPEDGASYDRLDDARAALGEAAFAAAWAEGRALTLEAAVALALEEEGPRSAATTRP